MNITGKAGENPAAWGNPVHMRPVCPIVVWADCAAERTDAGTVVCAETAEKGNGNVQKWCV